MAWVRIHDRALDHPKVAGIFDPRRPFDLWMWGLSYSQAHLTDGLLPLEAVPKGVGKAVQVLLARGLWEPIEGGWRVHDFLDWNDPKELVIRKRTEAKERMRNVRERSSREQPANVRESTSPEVLRGLGRSSVLSDLGSEKEHERKPVRGASVFAGSLPRDHVHHVLCDDTFSRCVPVAVHDKLANLLSPKHNGDREAAKAGLLAWYPTVWKTLPADFVMGDAFKFWQAQFDATFADLAPAAKPARLKVGARPQEEYRGPL